MAEDNTAPEEPIRFTDKRKYRPEDAAEEPDPLEEAEQILADVPEESIEVQQAHEEPAGEEGDLHEPDGGGAGPAATAPDFAPEDPQVAEEPQLREVPLDQAAGGVETEPEERIETAEEELVQQDFDREAELENDLRRVQAEYVNYRRRVERDRAIEKDRVKGQLIADLMPVLDDIAAARQAGDLEDGPFAHIASRLEQVLIQQGLSTVGAVGESFDPTAHEAIMQQPSEEVEADHIAVVVRSGYRFGDRLLRAAQVIISTGKAE